MIQEVIEGIKGWVLASLPLLGGVVCGLIAMYFFSVWDDYEPACVSDKCARWLTNGLGVVFGVLMIYLFWYNSHDEDSTREASDRIEAQIVGVIDGDTFVADIPGWPTILGNDIPIRIRGIDCPELIGPDSTLARLITDHLRERLESADSVFLVRPERGKYFRIVAKVVVDGEDIAQELIEAGLCGRR